MYGFEGVWQSEVQLSISELLSVLAGWVAYKRTSWSDLVGVRQKKIFHNQADRKGEGGGFSPYSTDRKQM